MSALVQTLFTTPAMAEVWSDEARLRGMLQFEVALARAEARAGAIPSEAADAIAAAGGSLRLDGAAIARGAASSGTVAIPLVGALRAAVGPEAGRWVHWGATSQDAIDTGFALQARAGLGLLDGALLAVADECAGHAERHRSTPMAGRTLLQSALPITFGLKAARWLALTLRQRASVHVLAERHLAVQLGGAAGTLASLGPAGPRIVELLAEELGLAAPELPWHAERDRVGALAAGLGVVAGAMAKVAGDLLLLAQSEVGEVAERTAPGRGGSSAMPQKRNPVDATLAVAAARLALGAVPVVLGAMAQEHERAAGAWHTEWAAAPDLFRYTAGAVEHVRSALAGLVVDPDRMSANLGAGGGLIMAESLAVALAGALGQPRARDLVEAACERVRATGADLFAVARDDPAIAGALSPAQIERALEPAEYLGSAGLFVDRALAAYRVVRGDAART